MLRGLGSRASCMLAHRETSKVVASIGTFLGTSDETKAPFDWHDECGRSRIVISYL